MSRNLRLKVAACIAAAAVGIVAVMIGMSDRNGEEASVGGQEEPAPPYTYTDMNVTMNAISPVAVRSLPSSLDGDPIGVLSTNQEVTVTGQCNETGWYRIEFDCETAYVNDKSLSEIKVEVHE